MAGCILMIIILIGIIILQRYINLQMQLKLRQESEAMLLEERKKLEIMVNERTQDLLNSNQLLEQKIKEKDVAEKDLRKAQNELIQASKLAALGQLSAGITHELNQPLAATKAYTRNASLFLQKNEQAKAEENLVISLQLLQKMSHIVNHLKSYSRDTSGNEKGSVNLHSAITNALIMLKPQFDEFGIQTQTNVDNHFYVIANTIRLEQVIVNILKNAQDALLDSDRRQIFISAEQIADKIILSIQDTGKGISKTDLHRLFDPFFTTKDIDQGLGLGLSISYTIISSFGGSIQASNSPDGGAIFSIELQKASQGSASL